VAIHFKSCNSFYSYRPKFSSCCKFSNQYAKTGSTINLKPLTFSYKSNKQCEAETELSCRTATRHNSTSLKREPMFHLPSLQVHWNTTTLVMFLDISIWLLRSWHELLDLWKTNTSYVSAQYLHFSCSPHRPFPCAVWSDLPFLEQLQGSRRFPFPAKPRAEKSRLWSMGTQEGEEIKLDLRSRTWMEKREEANILSPACRRFATGMEWRNSLRVPQTVFTGSCSCGYVDLL
jgi:hypothetical protein